MRFAFNAAAQAFVAVFPAELPDKSMMATLALTARFRNPRAVWVGVASAFLFHVAIAASVGGLLARLPSRLIAALAALMFVIGAIIMLREALACRSAGDVQLGERTRSAERSFGSIAIASFGVLALAELGDLTQFAIAALAARTKEPLSVGIGGWFAVAGVALLATVAGGWLTKRLQLNRIQLVAAGVFALLAILSVREVVG